jgi:hypothetical protein
MKKIKLKKINLYFLFFSLLVIPYIVFSKLEIFLLRDALSQSNGLLFSDHDYNAVKFKYIGYVGLFFLIQIIFYSKYSLQKNNFLKKLSIFCFYYFFKISKIKIVTWLITVFCLSYFYYAR